MHWWHIHRLLSQLSQLSQLLSRVTCFSSRLSFHPKLWLFSLNYSSWWTLRYFGYFVGFVGVVRDGKCASLGKCIHLEVHPASRFDSRAWTPPPEGWKEKFQWGCFPETSTLLVTSMWQTVFCALANCVLASAPGSQSTEYNILLMIRCNCLFVRVSSVLICSPPLRLFRTWLFCAQ